MKLKWYLLYLKYRRYVPIAAAVLVIAVVVYFWKFR
jgi:hypothetical protein